ncbi:MAG: Asp-tRNA(Asn)/Glu-tRNA(Gln) amidotransferase subunit GatB [Elusimicrobia bacterium]|nr:Asp-tRNA(Asn)/Glu-tRNA(Gln) amidotransferase subunit GatB [Elusimicrobiota bacterium]
MNSADFEMVAGLEVHCQLATKTKLFCSCDAQSFGAQANTAVCPVCTGQPGALPVLNRAAVELGFKAALALGCRLEGSSVFARKNYFYPDLPKAYQISQYEQPFATGGGLTFGLKDGPAKRARIRRIHLEEDAGKLLHAIGSRELDHTLVDLNRCGLPLVEIVSEPDLSSGEEAHAYLVALKEVLIYAGVSSCDMEKGELRCDANVSVRRKGETALGTKVEVKNLNSFKAVKEALDHELGRQAAVLREGGRLLQESRLWDHEARRTEAMRAKEEAHDYRYFPDPDLPALVAEPGWVESLRAGLPELPAARRERYAGALGLSDYDAGVLASQRALGDYFEDAARGLAPAAVKTVVNLITTELLGRLNSEGLPVERCPVPAAAIARLAILIQNGTLSTRLAKEAFARTWESGKGPDELVAELALGQISDEGQLRDWVRSALGANPKAVEDLKAGKDRAIGRIVGAVMKLSKGKANPALVNRLIKEETKA